MNQRELDEAKSFLREAIAQEENRRTSHSLTGIYSGSPKLLSKDFNTTEIIGRANLILQRFADEYDLRYTPISG